MGNRPGRRPAWEDVLLRASRAHRGPWPTVAIVLSVCAAGVLAPSKADDGFMIALGPAALAAALFASAAAVVSRRPTIGVWFVCGAVVVTVARALYEDALVSTPVLIGLTGQLAALTVVAVRAPRRDGNPPRDRAAAIDAVRVRYERRHLGAAAAESAVRALLSRGGA